MLSRDTSNFSIIDTNQLFEMLLNLDEPQIILVAGYIQGLATREMIETDKKEN